MTHILIELKNLETVLEDFVMKHLHMDNYKMVTEAKSDLRDSLVSISQVKEVVELPNVLQPLIDNAHVVEGATLFTPEEIEANVPRPSEHPDAMNQAVS